MTQPGMSRYWVVPQFLPLALPVSRRLRACVPLAALPFSPHHAPLVEAAPPTPNYYLRGAESRRGAPVSGKAGGAEVMRARSQAVGTKLWRKSPGLCPALDGRPPRSCGFPQPSQSGFQGAHPLAATLRNCVPGSPGSENLPGAGGDEKPGSLT